MRAVCIQPPLVQLNAPYPAVWYLDAWLRSRGVRSEAVDHSIALARALFSRDGLTMVFDAASKTLAGRSHPDSETARRIREYAENRDRYIATIEPLMDFLAGQDPGFAWRIAVGAGLPTGLPAGMRSAAVAGDGMGPDDARAWASAVLGDLADYISYALDPGFAITRYAERLGASAPSFGPVLDAARSSWVLSTLYRPIARALFGRIASEDGQNADEVAGAAGQCDRPDGLPAVLVLLTVPFPGCLAGAIAAAEEAHAILGDRAVIVAGGGYVSTELRFLDNPDVFDTFDYLAYDAGYGALASIIEALESGNTAQTLWQVRFRDKATGTVVAAGFDPQDNPRVATLESVAIADVHPDYAGLHSGSYLRIVDSANPMHRLWNDTPWLKYRLAYGCYWHRCAFCDTQLDYIARFAPASLESLLAAADAASSATGLYGIHFVDEAMPARHVRAFATANTSRRRPFTFWGNVRFDRSWDEKTCRAAAEGGLIAVSGGVEIATGAGLAMVDKGFGIPDLVRTLAAFKRVGILVHAYLMYGFPGQADRDMADAAEMTRVLLAEGLVDSAFWHKFVLTRHSALYGRWEKGEVPGLEPRIPASGFALNDLRFAGEEDSDKWTGVLDAALSTWAEEGRTEVPLQAFLPKGMPRPTIDALSILRAAGIR